MHLYYSRHVNGNGFYKPSHPLFAEYVESVYNSIQSCINKYNELSVAFDVAIDLLYSKETEEKSDFENKTLFRLRNIIPYIQNSAHILNISGDWEISNRVLVKYKDIMDRHPFTCLVHSKQLVKDYTTRKLDALPPFKRISRHANTSLTHSKTVWPTTENMPLANTKPTKKDWMSHGHFQSLRLISHTSAHMPKIESIATLSASELLSDGLYEKKYTRNYRFISDKCLEYISISFHGSLLSLFKQ